MDRPVDRLIRYFTEGLAPTAGAPRKVGIEVETSFFTGLGCRFSGGRPISREESEQIFDHVRTAPMWHVAGTFPTHGKILGVTGHVLQYELGRQNLELSLAPARAKVAVLEARARLAELYEIAAVYHAYPRYEPVFDSKEDLLVVPDDRDETWVKLDTRPVLNLLASTSAVQFTIDVSLAEAIPMLNRLGENIDRFLRKYPQDKRWREYIARSPARYRPDRYGGPLRFSSLEDYCGWLLQHPVVDLNAGKLIDHEAAGEYDIPLFLRSIWWYFRLRRYGPNLCIEVRPIPRCRDKLLQAKLNMVLGIMLSAPRGYGGDGH